MSLTVLVLTRALALSLAAGALAAAGDEPVVPPAGGDARAQPAGDGGRARVAADDDLDFFERRVRPILVQHCEECHSAEAKRVRGDLRLDSRAGWMAGGGSGAVIVPGDPDASRLVEAVRYEDHELAMPPAGKLADEDIATLVEWVQRGAPDPREGATASDPRPAIDLEAGREFWSFRPIADPPVPQVSGDAGAAAGEADVPDAASSASTRWALTDLDRFVLARMQAAGLAPAPDADRRTLLRRVRFDLTGLPPTPEEIADFLADDAPDAFERVVDRLLASRAYAERFGRHWLDVARFAESSGGGRSLMFPNAWRYRDHVIDSFERDLPFDRFLTEQIAGDLLVFEPTPEGDEARNRAITATGFLVLGPTNYEQQDKERLVWDVVDEQIDTIGRAFMGLTLGCARCHDHKFDPVPTTDYYALAGILSSTEILTAGNVSGYVETELQGPEALAFRQFEGREAALVAEVRELRRELGVDKAGGGKAAAPARTIERAELAGLVLDDSDATLIGDWKLSTSVAGYLDAGYLHDENVLKGEKSATFSPLLPADGVYEVRISYTSAANRATNVPVSLETLDGTVRRVVNQRQPPAIQGWFHSLGRHRLAGGMQSVITVSTEGTDGHVIVDALQLIAVDVEDVEEEPTADQPADGASKSKSKSGAAPGDAASVVTTPAQDLAQAAAAAAEAERARKTEQLAELEARLEALRKAAPPPPPRAMSVRDSSRPADAHVHLRGAVRSLGAEVPRGFLRVCSSSPAVIPDGTSGRLELAAWLTDPRHPLTARVYANRLWGWLFGEGLVRTPDNFGVMGGRPSHPELLDWLASRLVEDGWSTRRMLRRLVLSRTYRQAALPPPATDPEGRLLSSSRRQRLEAEALRDAILSVSGQLDRTAGGPTIRKLSQYDYDYQFDTRRRSVYVPAFRNATLELFEVFDLANPNLVSGRRNVSQVAPQALYLMNSPWVRQQARAAAERLLTMPGLDEDARLVRAFELALGRPPTEAERGLVEAHGTELVGSADQDLEHWTGVFHTLFSCLAFRYLD